MEGLTALANAAPDGYTLGAVWNGPLNASPQVRQLPYSLAGHRDRRNVRWPPTARTRTFPPRRVPEFVALLQQQPFRYTYGNEGKGGKGFLRGGAPVRRFARLHPASFDGSSAVRQISPRARSISM